MDSDGCPYALRLGVGKWFLTKTCEVACPVMPLTGTTAEDLHVALFQHSHVHPIVAFKNKLFELSIPAFDIYEADGASGSTTRCPKFHRILVAICHFVGIAKTI